MCTDCTLAFFMSPVKSGLVALSFAVALVALLMLRRMAAASTKKRLTLLYIHVFAFVFPFLFFLFFRGCQSYFSGCDQTKAIAVMLLLTGIIALVIALAVTPFAFARRYSSRSVRLESHYLNKLVNRQTDKLGMKAPELYVLDTAEPVAFSHSLFGSRIFVSAGMFDILGRKEIEAVVLHELAHIKGRSSAVRLTANIARLLSPFSALANFHDGSSISEERSADSFAASVQGTSSHISAAKVRIMRYVSESRGG